MNFAWSEWFGFKSRVKENMVFTKTENGETSTKVVYGTFNWWALLFTWFYALFSVRCRTPFFVIKTAVPFLALVLVNMLAQLLFTENVALTINVLGAIWYGFMFETWFKNQLVDNGYQREK
ncbi:hypothetical protein D1831_11940 [Lactiplantibacillus garii]|uniref:Integral membrane protein n=1 Tax=Lactiplantibacillus garii TaxID=2306423 RepID=A0A426D4S3_9LACO|nr:hypothetical protein [Lactiplantibacillus garii]RRK09580.1 hypothetical protein D1831_11940 [Lactiplantibacillus garii]